MKQNLQLCAFADEAGNRLEEQIAALKENGIPYLEMRGVNGKNVVQLTDEEAADITARLAEHGLRVWSLGSPAGKSKLSDDFAAEEARFERLLRIADITGARCIRLFSFYGADDSDACFEEICRRLNRFLEMAQGHSVVLCHENEKGIYGDMADRCLDLLNTFPQLEGIFDPANFIQCGQDTIQAWKLLRQRISYLHIKDALTNGKVVPAGKGEGHVRDILADFQARGGSDVTIEPHLSVFAGLKDLEREGEETKIDPFCYESSDAAFDAACNALKALL